MKDYYGQTILTQGSSFCLASSELYHALNSFHSHDETELLYIISGQGTFSIGDRSQRVASGAMLLIGAHVPHMFKFESNRYYDYATKHAKPTIPLKLMTLHFSPRKLGKEFWELSENTLVAQLLTASKKGILVNETTKLESISILEKLSNCETYESLPLVLQLLNGIASTQDLISETKLPEPKPFKKIDETRLSMIYLYTMDNFYKEIKLSDIANIVHMVPNAFCHYFRSRTGRSYFDFLVEVRIEHACKLLSEGNDSVVSICNDSGFSNLSNFNRYFKKKTGKSPVAYRQAHLASSAR